MIIVLGTNGTGKTTFLKKTLNQIKTERKLIVTPDPMEWTDIPLVDRKELTTFSGIKRLIYKEGDMRLLAEKIANCVLIFDDFKALFLEKRSEINALRTLAIRRRQRMLDLFIVAHGFTEIVPSYLFTFASKIILFRTLDNLTRIKNRLIDYEQVLAAQQKVNSSKAPDHFFMVLNFN